MTRRSSGRRRSLFDADQAELPFDAYDPPPEARTEWLEEQLPLFEGRAPLVGELELALWDADFPKAGALYEELLETYPAERGSADLEFLSRLPRNFWSPELSESDRLALWSSIGSALGRGSQRYRRVRNGFFRRLWSTSDPCSLVRAHPDSTADFANSLYANGDRRRGREVVREALLRGIELRPLEFEDREVADLLGEDEPAPWLASLGAIRFLWPRHTFRAEEVETLGSELSRPLPEEDSAKALDFWRCLCFSALGRSLPDELRYGTHKRMKRLHERFHREYFTGEPNRD